MITLKQYREICRYALLPDNLYHFLGVNDGERSDCVLIHLFIKETEQAFQTELGIKTRAVEEVVRKAITSKTVLTWKVIPDIPIWTNEPFYEKEIPLTLCNKIRHSREAFF